MADINVVVVAPMDEVAERIWITKQQMLGDVQTGNQRLLQPPVEPEELGTTQERAMMEAMFSIKAVGSPETIRKQLE